MSQFWAADPHQYGPGKIHIVDTDDATKTFCGRLLSAIPGSSKANKATCKTCLDGSARRPEQKQRHAESQARQAEYERVRAQENEAWHAWYAEYLKSEDWKTRRSKVMKRANGICEGCLSERAREVHHVTYKHVGNEFLWELRAVCEGCHDRVTELDQKAKSKPANNSNASSLSDPRLVDIQNQLSSAYAVGDTERARNLSKLAVAVRNGNASEIAALTAVLGGRR